MNPLPPTDLPFSAAADRNKAVVFDVLVRCLPEAALVLEVASGTGQHAAHAAGSRPSWTWQPSDADPGALPVIAARCAHLPNVRPPVRLDVLQQPWPARLGRYDAVYCANLLHISPWATCAALMQGAANHLAPEGALVLYGPYRVDGEPTAPSNQAFDADLRRRDPAWGLRRLADVCDAAAAAGLSLQARHDVPANNLMLVFRRA